MAKDATDNIAYYVKIDSVHKEDIASIRHWTNLKVAFDKNCVWITNFEDTQINAAEVKSLPYKTIYYNKNGKLYLLNSLLPDCNLPAVLWTPIERALPLKTGSYNHNFFGIEEKINIKLVESETEKEAEVMMVEIYLLKSYMETAPEVRLQNIHWVLISPEQAVLFGKPLLPVNGKVYWKNKNAIIPAGYNFDLHMLTDILLIKINPEKNCWILWDTDSSFIKIEKHLLEPLSISSFRKTYNQLQK